MSTPISPWDLFARRLSSDGRYDATFNDANEIAMGGPSLGTLRVRDKKDERLIVEMPGVGASFVWSSDSRAIAVPHWTKIKDQRLRIVRIPSGEFDESKDEYSVLQLESFDDYRLIGVDSPIYLPRKIKLQFTPSDQEKQKGKI